MGYTHSFEQKRNFTSAEWEEITSKAKKLMQAIYSRYGVVISYYNEQKDAYENIQCDDDIGKVFYVYEEEQFFAFDGDVKAGLDHEPFCVGQTIPDGEFSIKSWCKTNRKPYDRLVAAILLLIHKIAPDAFEIGGDGCFYSNYYSNFAHEFSVCDDEWHEAAFFLLETFPEETFLVPKDIWSYAKDESLLQNHPDYIQSEKVFGENNGCWPISFDNLNGVEEFNISWTGEEEARVANLTYVQELMDGIDSNGDSFLIA